MRRPEANMIIMQAIHRWGDKAIRCEEFFDVKNVKTELGTNPNHWQGQSMWNMPTVQLALCPPNATSSPPSEFPPLQRNQLWGLLLTPPQKVGEWPQQGIVTSSEHILSSPGEFSWVSACMFHPMMLALWCRTLSWQNTQWNLWGDIRKHFEHTTVSFLTCHQLFPKAF